MFIIRVEARLFEHLLPVIDEFQEIGFKYIRDQDDGTCGRAGVNLVCCKIIYFDDGENKVKYEDRTQG